MRVLLPPASALPGLGEQDVDEGAAGGLNARPWRACQGAGLKTACSVGGALGEGFVAGHRAIVESHP